MDNSSNDPDKLDVEPSKTERRREWMSAVVSSLKTRDQQSGAASKFPAMSAAMRKHRAEIEDAIVKNRAAAVTETE